MPPRSLNGAPPRMMGMQAQSSPQKDPPQCQNCLRVVAMVKENVTNDKENENITQPALDTTSFHSLRKLIPYYKFCYSLKCCWNLALFHYYRSTNTAPISICLSDSNTSVSNITYRFSSSSSPFSHKKLASAQG